MSTMTETYRILRLLGRRVAATTFYRVGDVVDGRDGQMSCLSIHLEDAHVLVFIEEDPVNARAKMGFSFLAMKESSCAVHLNHWVRPPGRMSVPALVNDLWESFWEHEVENRQLGRIQWMHGSELPYLEEDLDPTPVDFDKLPDTNFAEDEDSAKVHEVAVAAQDPLEELLASILPGPPQKALLIDVLDLFD